MIEKIKGDLQVVDWNERLKNLKCNDSFNEFHNKVCKTIDTHAPETERKISYKRQATDPWMTTGLMTSLIKQKRLYKEQLHNRTDVSKHKYRQYCNTLKN